MFPERRRMAMPPHRPVPRPIGRRPNYRSSAALPNLVSRFKNREGQFDLERITETAVQLNKLYNQVSPIVSNIRSRIR